MFIFVMNMVFQSNFVVFNILVEIYGNFIAIIGDVYNVIEKYFVREIVNKIKSFLCSPAT